MTDKMNDPTFDREYDLADFTDRVFEDKAPKRASDKTRKALEDLVLVIKAHTPDEPSDEIRQEIKKNAQAAYAQTFLKPEKAEAKGGLLNLFGRKNKRGYQSQSQRRQVLATRLAAAAVIVIAALALLLPSSGTPGGYTGAAKGVLGFWLPVAVIIVAAVIIAWLWLKDE